MPEEVDEAGDVAFPGLDGCGLRLRFCHVTVEEIPQPCRLLPLLRQGVVGSKAGWCEEFVPMTVRLELDLLSLAMRNLQLGSRNGSNETIEGRRG